MTSLNVVAKLTDERLLTAVHRLNGQSNRVQAELLVYLGELDHRGLYAAQACASTFSWCTERMGMSEDVAYRRIRVARLARQHPAVLSALAEGRVHLSGLAAIASHFTNDNCGDLLARIARRSKREIEALAAALAPKPDVPDRITLVAAAPALALAVPSTEPPAPGPVVTAPPAAPKVEPLSEARYKVTLTASERLVNKLRAVQDLLSHSVPDGDLAEVLERALDALHTQLLKRKYGASAARAETPEHEHATAPTDAEPEPATEPTAGPKPEPEPKPRTRYIPTATRARIWKRDGGRCTQTDATGHRCTETRHLQIHHLEPYARGGASTVDGLTLRCRAHNAHEAHLAFGKAHVRRRIAQQRAKRQ